MSQSDLRLESEHWAESQLALPFRPGPQTLDEYLQLRTGFDPAVTGGNSPLRTPTDSALHEIAHNDFAQEDCLVDNWVGRERLAFVDVSAGPFRWGPVIGGEGVRTEASLPRVEMMQRLVEQEVWKQEVGEARAREADHLHDKEANEEEEEDGDKAAEEVNWELLDAERLVLDDLISAHCPSVARGEVEASELGLEEHESEEDEDEEEHEQPNEDGVLSPATCMSMCAPSILFLFLCCAVL